MAMEKNSPSITEKNPDFLPSTPPYTDEKTEFKINFDSLLF